MLTILRKKQKSAVLQFVFWAIIAAFVGTIFLVWGRGSDNAGSNEQLALSVNGDEISYEDYQRAYSNMYRLYQNLYKERFNKELERQLGLREQAKDQLITQQLLLQEADNIGLEISEDELVKSIANYPAFQDNGQFSKQRYLEVLAYQRLNPEQFEAMQEQQLLADKMRDQLKQGVTVDEAAIVEEFKKQNDKTILGFLRFAPALFEDKVEVTPEALQEFFTSHRENYRIEDRVALHLIKYDPSDFVDQVTMNDAEIDRYYQRHLDQWDVQEQVQASHVLIRVDQDADDATREQKRELAEKVLEEAKSGKDFSGLVKTYSDDKASVAKQGDLGYFTRGTMVAAFEQAAFNMQPGELSDVVESPFGFHIIKATGYIKPGVKPLADVLDEVKDGLRAEMSRQLAYEKALDAYNINRKTGDLEAAAETAGLQVIETPLFGRNDSVPEIGRAPAISAAAFALEEGQLARPVTLPDGIYLFTLKEQQPNHLPELDKVKAAVEKDYRTDQARKLAEAAASEALNGLKEGTPLDKVSKISTIKPEETDAFPITYGSFVPKIGNSEELGETAFQLTEENPVAPEVYEIGGKYVIATLKERTKADLAELSDEKKTELRDSLQSKLENEALQENIDALKEKAQISISISLQNFLKED